MERVKFYAFDWRSDNDSRRLVVESEEDVLLVQDDGPVPEDGNRYHSELIIVNTKGVKKTLPVHYYPQEAKELFFFSKSIELCVSGLAFPMFVTESPDNKGLDTHRANLVIVSGTKRFSDYAPFNVFCDDDPGKKEIVSTLASINEALDNKLKIVPASFLIQTLGYLYGEFHGGGSKVFYSKDFVVPEGLRLNINGGSNTSQQIEKLSYLYAKGLDFDSFNRLIKTHKLGDSENIDLYLSRINQMYEYQPIFDTKVISGTINGMNWRNNNS